MTKFAFIKKTDPVAGFREGAKGTHSSRTTMVRELGRVLESGLMGVQLERAVLDENLLEKATSSGRALSLQRLKELYGLNEATPVFGVLRLLWALDRKSLPLLAVLAALARDPLLRATARPVLGLARGSELMRDTVRSALAAAVGNRLSEPTLDKVVRNTCSSWAQSGHLSGRTFKRRSTVSASPAAFAFAVWLAQKAGFAGEDILSSGWVMVLDLDPEGRRQMLERTRSVGLLEVRQLGSMVEIDASRLSGAS